MQFLSIFFFNLQKVNLFWYRFYNILNNQTSQNLTDIWPWLSATVNWKQRVLARYSSTFSYVSRYSAVFPCISTQLQTLFHTVLGFFAVGIFAVGIFAVGFFAVGFFAIRSFRRTDFLLFGFLPSVIQICSSTNTFSDLFYNVKLMCSICRLLTVPPLPLNYQPCCSSS